MTWPSAQAWTNFFIAGFTGLLMLFTLWQYQLGVSTQRAAVYLGLPNGQVADFVGEKDTDQLVLYFRNYGASTAENTVIEFWPVVAEIGDTVQQCVPKFQGFNRRERHLPGIQIPPGFPYAAYIAFPHNDRERIDAGQAIFNIIGRISYTDAFGQYCQTFAIQHQHSPTAFTISTEPSPDFCDTAKGHAMIFMSVKTSPTERTESKPLTLRRCPP